MQRELPTGPKALTDQAKANTLPRLLTSCLIHPTAGKHTQGSQAAVNHTNGRAWPPRTSAQHWRANPAGWSCQAETAVIIGVDCLHCLCNCPSKSEGIRLPRSKPPPMMDCARLLDRLRTRHLSEARLCYDELQRGEMRSTADHSQNTLLTVPLGGRL